MGKIRFKLKHRVATVFRYVFRRRISPVRYSRLGGQPNRSMSMRAFFSWTHSLKKKAKAICSKKFGSGSDRGYLHVGEDPVLDSHVPVPVPKGYVTVYVGKKDGDFERVFVPVFYFKHPLFCELLKEAEEEYGYDHPGGITLPCPISQFENVQTRINHNRVNRKMFMRN